MSDSDSLKYQKDLNDNVQIDKPTISTEASKLDAKFKTERISWIICLISFLLISIFGSMMSMSWYPSRILQGWPVVISIIVCLCSLIVAINQSVNARKLKRAAQATSDGQFPPSESKTLKNSSANSIVSLICAIIPIILYFWHFIYTFSSPHSSSDQSGWVIVIYYWTIGFWLIPVWLICGILGLKSKKRKIAIVSLVIKPVGFAIFCLSVFITSR